MSDHFMKSVMNVLYHGFNFVTGYDPWTVAAVRRVEVDHPRVLRGRPWIRGGRLSPLLLATYTEARSRSHLHFREEAENERMHLLVSLKMFEASPITRALCVAAQFGMRPSSRSPTRFIRVRCIGRWLPQETAVQTRSVGGVLLSQHAFRRDRRTRRYDNLVDKTTAPGNSSTASGTASPRRASPRRTGKLPRRREVGRLPPTRSADESHHRDVNHTFATLPRGRTLPSRNGSGLRPRSHGTRSRSSNQ